MSQERLIIIDNESDTVIYGGREWTGSKLSRWYGGSSTWPVRAPGLNGSSGSLYGALSFSFHGTAVAFYGNTPVPGGLYNTTVSIDGGSPYNSSFPDPTSQTYLQWYQSPQLPEGNHTIGLTNLADVSVDFIVVTAGPSTPLTGQTIIIDDGDPSIQYSGTWSRDTALFDASTNNPGGFPFHNNTHRSMAEGAALTLEFAGTSIGVFGIFDFSTLGNLSAIFDLDGQSTPMTYVVGPDTPEFQSHTGRRPNFPYFTQTSLAGGNHTLSISLTQSNNIPFVLDFLTYHPSSPAPEASPHIPSPSSPSFPPPLPTSPPTRSSSLAGPITGAVIGVLALFVLTILTWRRVHRRKRNGVARLMGTPNLNPTVHPLRFPESPLNSFHARPAGSRYHSPHSSSVADIWPVSKAQQNVQDQIRNKLVFIEELEQMRGGR